ncbi:UDP-N-acetylmuramoyl-L-alanyl-D-glutamate--2,6-diaminopimelate ligase [Blattabacterium cuenoti]|uniref:UDP-N-acetylmuramoyl-L-alanyl-D-glutamate--2, 6-diaminopimelate ligase n=1 Tax=Blattabacterium cuenoti TaxID=1653831 RepID=UPI00163C3D3F|nr:UDP-N-acetylmuramoyl-L-alanyl-D-glutamate--2,6-diaminopimelate ligase [Blattabacterium cuenoti]
MKKVLKNVLKGVHIIKKIGKETSQWIIGISISSPMIHKHMIFIAIKGEQTDGHFFIEEAIKNGSQTIVCEYVPISYQKNVLYILVPNSKKALGKISSNFYENPTKKIKLIGITGTNGKTSVAYILHQLFSNIGKKSILISTIGVKILSKVYPNSHTTPNIIDINKYLYVSIRKGCQYAFMEVSSHGIHQQRIEGLSFEGGIFTNITHDHLDYHQSFHHYLYTKRNFFQSLSKKSFALINIDDKNSHKITRNILAKKYFYGLKNNKNFFVKVLRKNLNGSQLLIDGTYPIFTKIIGKFNIYNILAVYATSILLQMDKDIIIKNLSNIKPVKGRFEQFLSKKGIRIIVDYAHNPNGLKSVLKTITDLTKKKDSKLICVVGCGGNRDRKKRSIMGKMVYETCDISIFTSDNPRSEDPHNIIKDMKNFSSYLNSKKNFSFINRKQAINQAIQIANKNDIVLIVGKGHENYQEIKGIQYPFNDMKIAKKFLFDNKK